MLNKVTHLRLKASPFEMRSVEQSSGGEPNGNPVSHKQMFRPLLVSAHSPWKDTIWLQECIRLAGKASISTDKHMIGICGCDSTVKEDWKISGMRRMVEVFSPGILTIIAAGDSSVCETSVRSRPVMVLISPIFMSGVADQLAGVSGALTSRVHVDDEQIRNLIFSLFFELKAGCPSGRLFGESVATALCVHLLRNYAEFPATIPEPRGSLPSVRLKRVLDYVQAHLDADLSLTELASVADMSIYHFSRLFSQSTGFSPHRYILRLRVRRAKELLQRKDLSLSAIACDLGFAHQGHFTTTFRRLVGMTPGSYRNLVGISSQLPSSGIQAEEPNVTLREGSDCR